MLNLLRQAIVQGPIMETLPLTGFCNTYILLKLRVYVNKSWLLDKNWMLDKTSNAADPEKRIMLFSRVLLIYVNLGET